MIRKIRMQGLAMIHTNLDMVIDMEGAVDIFANSIQESSSLNICFSNKFAMLKSRSTVVLLS